MNGLIYLVKNKVNGKGYVGQTTSSLKQRKREHLTKSNGTPKLYFHKALSKHGSKNFEWTILESNIKTQKRLNLLEKFHIIHHRSRVDKWGYNLRDGGPNGKHSIETKKLISKNNCKHWLGKARPTFMSKRLRYELSKSKQSKYPGALFERNKNPERKCWRTQICVNGKIKKFGYFEDPITASILYSLIFNELYRGDTYD